ncbi:uncharacterized protein MEPE_04549 [Melanopsichium pennsylvanicum]|uniref:RING-type domain-containing protein n=2 Tax=Melanopsichium pennsylvanicum TaxID=63383 RepID=A0AAJ4XP04_9BASI|nr:uncharacterized protein MEPE_04549 [Melanopsichium pennsylvanicum]
MSSLLSFARAGPTHRTPHDEEAAIASSQSPNSSRWYRPFVNTTNSTNQHASAVEMSPQLAPPTTGAGAFANNDNIDVEQAQAHHERGASGRSFLSAVSIPSLSNLRQRDRDQERRRQNARVQAQQASTSDGPSSMLTTLGDDGRNPSVSAGLAPTTDSRSAPKKSRSSRREREEAATLFGPNLANYFGSGISSSGAVSSHGAGVPQPPALTSPISPADPSSTLQTNDTTTSGADSVSGTNTTDGPYAQASLSARRARLGSRGRARGASLSGLSMMSLGAESVTSLGGINTERANATMAPATGMMQGSTADLIDQLNRDGASADGHIAMSEGIDITTLQRWIQRSTGLSDGPTIAPAAPTTFGPPVCTTLQSFVNLKRNTLKLSTKTDAANIITTTTTTTIDNNNNNNNSSNSNNNNNNNNIANSAKDTDVNILRTRSSLSVLPALSYGTPAATPVARAYLPESTHSLYFEYDCAAPFASVQIFIRASRKHGSWINWQPSSADEADPLVAKTNVDGSTAWLAQSGPPPHVLGWPVHVAKLKKGFGVAHTANIPLQLRYFAPPKASAGGKRAVNAGNDKETTSKRETAMKESATPAAIPETPGIFEHNRRLEFQVDADDDEDNATAANTRRNATISASQPGHNIRENRNLATATEGMTTQPVIEEEETKERRLAREKAERETLKVAIVVEALDENARPLREPNLQTTYLRLTSLPVKKSVTERVADSATSTGVNVVDSCAPVAAAGGGMMQVARTWSSQVEGQEAEIGPHRFQMQELYGLSSKPPAVAPAAVDGEDGEEAGAGVGGGMVPMDMEASNGSECLICLSSPPTTLLLPCTHGLCLECAVQLRDSVVGIRQSERRRGKTPRRKYACPVCRRAYTSMLHLSKADEKSLAQQNAAITSTATVTADGVGQQQQAQGDNVPLATAATASLGGGR